MTVSERSEGAARLSVFKTYKLYVGGKFPAPRAAGCTR